MSDSHRLALPQDQETIRAKCFHPSGTFVEFPIEDVETSIQERFEKIVRKYPDRVAVEMADQIVTYAELNATANRLARVILAQQGNKPEPVGLLFEKGIPLIAAMLGVLKAGNFFVLLDKSFPKARISTILEDSQARLVITCRQTASLAQEFKTSGCQLLELESIDCGISDEDLKLCISPKAFASIVYTSGSTGQPKGVVWDHRALLHITMLRTIEIRACEHDRIAFLSSGTANAVANCFFSLLNGSALLSFDVQKEGVARLARWLSQKRISICLISSPLFRNLCETLTGEERFSDLRILRLRSETVYKTDVDLYKKYFPSNCILLTGLSSSETGQLSTYLINHNTEIAGSEVPVGYVVQDKEISLLDDTGKELGFNEVGQIAVRSRYFPPGYWQKPNLSRAKFRRDTEHFDQQLCLTGDLGLMLPDGCLLHKGRKDFRVKVRGYGVELAEVEKALLQHAAVKDAVVVARVNELGEARLVAYYTCFGQPSPNVSELRGFLKKKLPDYMIPPSFVMVDAIPLTANGKVDRGALPDPKNSRDELDTSFVSARNSKEERLVEICAEVLSLEKLGIHDNFFDLGGNSLTATRVISRIRDDYQVELSLSQLFETPTVAALVDQIETGRRTPHGVDALPLLRASRDGQLVLSFAQQRLWFLDQLEPGSSAYNFSSVFKLEGQLNVKALEESFNEIIKRHETLRTVFHTVDGSPFQIILPFMTIKLRRIDLRNIVSNKERDSEARRLTTAEGEEPFDLAHGPLLRVTLIQLMAGEFRLLLTMHHIVSDGWSMGVLFRELNALYEAYSKGSPSPLVALPVQYADFAQWQRQQLRGERLEKQLVYWKKQLEGAPTLQLPTDRPRPALRTTNGGRHHFVLSDDLSVALKSLTNRYGVSLFMLLLGAYQTLLQRFTGQEDIVVGAPVAGRDNREIESLIGFFLNMLVFRTDLTGDPTFFDLLIRVRKTCLQAYSHQDLPFDKLVEELHLERNLSHHPLFQVTFALQNTPKCPLLLNRVSATELERNGGVRFDLHLFMEEEDGHLQGWIDYSKDLFNGKTIDQMLSHFRVLLEGVVDNPEQRISDLPILTEAEKHQLLVEWNETKRDYPKDKCVHQLFEEQAKRISESIAVVFEDHQLTYGEVNTRANQLAHYLRKLGVGPEVLVAICMERSLEMIVGLLGILKAGGAYVPMDPEYPKERLGFMLEDTHVSIVLTDVVSLTSLPLTSARVICLDRDWEEVAREPHSNSISTSTADSLAYVIYTSGSTGRPKGVAVSHRGINRLVMNTDYVQVTPSDVVAQVSNVSFDAATFEIWGTLLNGARLALITKNTFLSPQSLSKAIDRDRITTLFLTTALFNQMVEQIPAALGKLRHLLFGGDAADPRSVKRLLHKDPPRRLLHVYGPTETTTFALWYQVEAVAADATTVSIGRPIGNTQVYILDAHLNPVPIGGVGEIHIGGDGLARGYLNRPELTAEKFIYHSFNGEPARRMYKTGDLARYLPDGNIEFLGRIDNQVKLRGYRIELGEVETVLGQDPMVQSSVVVVREDVAGDKRLVAYVVARPKKSFEAAEIRNYLKQKLPEYMIPSAFVLLDELPLTSNGKVDRDALSAPDQDRPELGNVYQAPRTPMEETLGTIWSELLKVEKVGIQDNFFELGGHSLLATQVISRVRSCLSVELPLRTLFESPTIEQMAVAIMELQEVQPGQQEHVSFELESLPDEGAQRLVAEETRSTSAGEPHE